MLLGSSNPRAKPPPTNTAAGPPHCWKRRRSMTSAPRRAPSSPRRNQADSTLLQGRARNCRAKRGAERERASGRHERACPTCRLSTTCILSRGHALQVYRGQAGYKSYVARDKEQVGSLNKITGFVAAGCCPARPHLTCVLGAERRAPSEHQCLSAAPFALITNQVRLYALAAATTPAAGLTPRPMRRDCADICKDYKETGFCGFGGACTPPRLAPPRISCLTCWHARLVQVHARPRRLQDGVAAGARVGRDAAQAPRAHHARAGAGRRAEAGGGQASRAHMLTCCARLGAHASVAGAALCLPHLQAVLSAARGHKVQPLLLRGVHLAALPHESQVPHLRQRHGGYARALAHVCVRPYNSPARIVPAPGVFNQAKKLVARLQAAKLTGGQAEGDAGEGAAAAAEAAAGADDAPADASAAETDAGGWTVVQ